MQYGTGLKSRQVCRKDDNEVGAKRIHIFGVIPQFVAYNLHFRHILECLHREQRYLVIIQQIR